MDALENLCRRSRAYQVLYAMGDSPATVPTLEESEIEPLIELARQVQRGERRTVLQRKLANASPALLEYVTQEVA